VAEKEALRPASSSAVRRRNSASAILASPLLRLQRLDRQEAHREAAIHAPQSSQARIGRLTRTVALEQLSILLAGRTRTGARQRRLGKDFVYASGGVKNLLCRLHRFPPLQRTQEPALSVVEGTGHPQLW